MIQLHAVNVLAIVFTLAIAFSATGQEPNWPQWLGPDRNKLTDETGLLRDWPADGPRRSWLFEDCGLGYGGPAVVDGRLYILGARGGEDFILCLDANTGREIWHASMGSALENDWGDGSRGTPTVVDGRVYALSGSGTVICVDARDGREVWRTSSQDLGGETPYWGYSESVLVDGSRVLFTPGGEKGAIVALDTADGKVVWRAEELTEGAHYSSIIRAEFHRRPQYVQLMETRLVGLGTEDGKLLWQVDFPGDVAVIPTPLAHDGKVFVTAGYGAGCMLIDVAADNTATKIYENKVMKNHHGGIVRVGEHVYGHSDGTGWVCMDFKTGEQKWRERSKLSKGAVAYADGMLYCLGEDDGTIVLIEASPDGWKEHGRFTLSPQSEIRSDRGKVWTHPVIVDGKLYLRDQDKLSCFDVKAP
jgi:outer membrane protein assembly factor BamB